MARFRCRRVLQRGLLPNSWCQPLAMSCSVKMGSPDEVELHGRAGHSRAGTFWGSRASVQQCVALSGRHPNKGEDRGCPGEVAPWVERKAAPTSDAQQLHVRPFAIYSCLTYSEVQVPCGRTCGIFATYRCLPYCRLAESNMEVPCGRIVGTLHLTKKTDGDSHIVAAIV